MYVHVVLDRQLVPRFAGGAAMVVSSDGDQAYVHLVLLLVLLGATWCDLVRHGATWCYMVLLGATWCYLVLLGAVLCLLVLLGSVSFSRGVAHPVVYLFMPWLLYFPQSTSRFEH